MEMQSIIWLHFLIKSKMEIKELQVFGKHIFGSDVDIWLKLCKDQKKEWILKYTNQTSDVLIDEFINNPLISKDCKCLDCGKNKKNDNISKGVSEEVATDVVVAEVTNDSKRTSNKRRTNNKSS